MAFPQNIWCLPLMSLLITMLLPISGASQVGPFHLQLDGPAGYQFENYTIGLRPIPGSNATIAAVDKTSPKLVTRCNGNMLNGARVPSLDPSFQALGPTGGLIPASSIGKLQRREFIFQNVSDAGNSDTGKAFKESIKDFYLFDISIKNAYYLYSKARANFENGWLVCPGTSDGEQFGQLFYAEFRRQQPPTGHCRFVGLKVVPAMATT